SPGNVVAFITTGGLLAKPIRQLSEVQSTIQKGLAAAEDIFDLFDEPVEKNEGGKVIERVAGKVEFRDVCFAYDDDENDLVLDHISFTVNPGETIALVGRSGSGKSTLASLIPRFYSPLSGQILLDDQPVETLNLASLREQIALVTQHVTLFNDTVARNIAYGTLAGAPVEAIEEAAEKAYASGFIDELDHGMDTVVGDDGVLLSGGQRQRLAIARAFLKDAPVLILDEATSALDSESESYIQRALEAVVQGRTTFVIAHRLSTIENADRILVIDKGRLAEQGTHAELLAKGGHYANLHKQKDGGEASQSRRSARSQTLVPVPEAPSGGGLLPGSLPGSEILTGSWYRSNGWTRYLAPLAVVFTLLAERRRKRISGNPEAHWRAPVPVVVVGNINVGGTGKSPLVIWLADFLKNNGYRPGIVSRGYGGKGDYPLTVTENTEASLCGDEAVMLARRSGCPVIVDPDRPAAVRHLLATTECNIVISDDGLQHYALDRDLEIIVVDASKGLGNGLCLPAGPLREPPARLNEADLVVVNGTGDWQWSGISHQMTLTPTALVRLSTGERLSLQDPALPPLVHAVAGIGHPERFFRTLSDCGLQTVSHAFPDHHRFTLKDLMFGDELPVVMTEKDAVKIAALNPSLVHAEFYYLEVSAAFDRAFEDRLMAIMAEKTNPSQATAE
ncbi:MAG: tetraacyldisaccharide 4'-kinase, partial [Pseudomonadales bacterium]|nr:tetraacyldisaccharide 4'-kinase [Pseudomonadales bacterium]